MLLQGQLVKRTRTQMGRRRLTNKNLVSDLVHLVYASLMGIRMFEEDLVFLCLWILQGES
jgi:hypothetical protein